MLGLNYGPSTDPRQALDARRPAPFPSTPAIATITMSSRASSRNLPPSWSLRRGRKRRTSRSSSTLRRCSRSRWPRAPGSGGRASTPIWCRANLAPGCSWARSSRTSSCRPTRRNRTIADNAAPASTRVRRLRFRRPTSSTRGAAFPISRSSTRAQFPASFGPRWETASMGATTASPSARGTSSQAKGGKRNLRRAPTSTRRPWPNSHASTRRRSGPFSPAARSSGSVGRASCAM